MLHGDLPPPRGLLTDNACSVPCALGDVGVEPREFASRRDFAEYIDDRFLNADVFVSADEPGMWEWLSLFYFDEVCPPNKKGFRKPGVEGRHLLRAAGIPLAPIPHATKSRQRISFRLLTAEETASKTAWR